MPDQIESYKVICNGGLDTTENHLALADQNYGSSRLWWVIAFFNQTPTEASLEFGKVIFIPHPLERVLSIYGV